MPTMKQKLAFKKTVENGGFVSPAMKNARYSPAMAKNPQKLTKSKGWHELMNEFLPDDSLILVHAEGLMANKVISVKIVGAKANEATDDFIEVPDHPIRKQYLELAYRIKGRLGVDTQINQFNASDMTLEFSNRDDSKTKG